MRHRVTGALTKASAASSVACSFRRDTTPIVGRGAAPTSAPINRATRSREPGASGASRRERSTAFGTTATRQGGVPRRTSERATGRLTAMVRSAAKPDSTADSGVDIGMPRRVMTSAGRSRPSRRSRRHAARSFELCALITSTLSPRTSAWMAARVSNDRSKASGTCSRPPALTSEER